MTVLEPREGGLPDPVRYWARRAPGRIALRTARESWSYAELDEVVSETARTLFRGEVDPGAAVSLEVRDPLATAVLLHAAHRLLAVAVPLGPRLTEAEALETVATVDNQPVVEVIRAAIAEHIESRRSDDRFRQSLRERIQRAERLLKESAALLPKK